MSLIRKLLDWFTGKKHGDTLPEKPVLKVPPPPPPIRKGSLEDIRDFCDEVRKDLWIKKKTDDRLYVEMGNLSKKIDGLIEGQKDKPNEEHSPKG